MIQLVLVNADVLKRHVAAESNFDMEGTLATLTDDCLFIE